MCVHVCVCVCVFVDDLLFWLRNSRSTSSISSRIESNQPSYSSSDGDMIRCHVTVISYNHHRTFILIQVDQEQNRLGGGGKSTMTDSNGGSYRPQQQPFTSQPSSQPYSHGPPPLNDFPTTPTGSADYHHRPILDRPPESTSNSGMDSRDPAGSNNAAHPDVLDLLGTYPFIQYTPSSRGKSSSRRDHPSHGLREYETRGSHHGKLIIFRLAQPLPRRRCRLLWETAEPKLVTLQWPGTSKP